MDIAGIGASKSYPINDTLYKRIREEGIQIKYKETGRKAFYSLTDLINDSEDTAYIHMPSNCLQIQSWLEIQWDIAHELGHYLNWKDGRASENTLENERRAWNRGEEILKECEIPLFAPDGEWVISKNFHEEVGRCLGTYRVSKIMVEGKNSEKIKAIIKETYAFIVKAITIYFTIIGMLALLINEEERKRLFTTDILKSLSLTIFILYVCYFIIKKYIIVIKRMNENLVER